MAYDLTARLRLIDNMTAPMRKATQQIQRTESMSKKLTNSIGGFTKQVAGISSAIGLTYGLAKGFGMVRDSLDSAFNRIDTMETFQNTMTILTGSADKAKAALEATTEAVTGTAYGLDVAAKGVQNFVTRGMDIDKATNVMAAWGDAVAFYGDGTNEQLATVSDALAKMYSTGKVHADQLNRLYDVGINAVGMYAQVVGRDVASVQEDLSKGAISAEEFISTVTTAMMEGTNGVVKIAGAAKDGGSTWRATFDNMKAAVTRGTTEIIKSIDDMLTSNGLSDMRGLIANFGVRFNEVLVSIADNIPTITEKLSQMYEKAQPGIDWIKDTGMPAMRDAIGFVVEKAQEMYAFIKNNWSTIKPIIIGLVIALASLKVAFIAMEIISKVTTFIKAFRTATLAARLAMLGLNGTMLANPITWVIAAIVALIAVGVLLWRNWDKIKAKASELWQWIKNMWTNIGQAISDFINNSSGSLATFVTIVQEYFTAVWDVVVIYWEFIKQSFSNALEFVKAILSGDFARAKEIVFEQLTLMYETVLQIWERIKEYFANVLEIIVGWLSDKFNTAKDNVMSAMESLKTGVLGIWDGIKSGIADSINSVIDKINDLLSIDLPSFMGGGTIGINIPKIGGSHYHGLDSVPYDGYIARLHKGETVLTRQEAQAYREGQSGSAPNINITGNTFNVRQDSDIDAIADALYRKIKASWEAGA